jgi:hypothetical protein
VTSLTAIFGNSPEKQEVDSEKLLDLYWNRAELKKEFASLRERNYQLQDRVKHHEGQTVRMQQKLDHLEGLLLDPEWVHNVVAFFQLRRLSMRCTGRIARFAEQLKQQREKKQHSQALVAWNEERKRNATEIQRKIGERRMRVQMLEDRLQSERHRLTTMNGLLRFFKGRRVTKQLDSLAAELVLTQQRESDLLVKLDELQKLSPPDHQGLDVAAKRTINFMILSYAQQLFLHLADDEIATLSKEASEKSVGAVNYGDKKRCDFILRKIAKRLESMEESADSVDVLQHRARLIAEDAMFRSDEDAVPVAGSVSTVYSINANNIVKKRDGNLLGDNYWGLVKILSR